MLVQGPRGTRDILPSEVGAWQKVESLIRELCARYGYEEIRTPMFERTELFQRGIGDTTDVVEKEMYTFTDRGGRSLTLRPENTASAVRAYLQNKLYAGATPTKLFYIGSMFRYDRPQAGRYREFHQFGVEALGEQSPVLDAEVILLAMDFLQNLGLTDLTLHLNSVGCPTCRPVYRQKLQDYFRPHVDELCEDCRARLERNPLRILDCKHERCHALAQDAPKIVDTLCEECATHFEAVQKYLQAAGASFARDPLLVRGLDYYTKTAFEIKYPPLGAQSAVAGGGRYDGLVEEIGGPATPGMGFAVGLERALLAVEKQGLNTETKARMDVFFVALGAEAMHLAFRFLHEARAKGLRAGMDVASHGLKAQMKQAAKRGAKCVVLLGENEMQARAVTLKNMATGTQTTIPFAELWSAIQKA